MGVANDQSIHAFQTSLGFKNLGQVGLTLTAALHAAVLKMLSSSIKLMNGSLGACRNQFPLFSHGWEKRVFGECLSEGGTHGVGIHHNLSSRKNWIARYQIPYADLCDPEVPTNP